METMATDEAERRAGDQTVMFLTPRGVQVLMTIREGTNDWNTLNACMTEDEYGLRDWHGTAIISTIRYTRTSDCLWAAVWSRVPANGSSNNASQGSGCDGVRTVSTISCT